MRNIEGAEARELDRAVVLPEWRLPNNHVYAYAAKKDMTSPETPLSIFLEILQSASDTMKTASDLLYAAAEADSPQPSFLDSSVEP